MRGNVCVHRFGAFELDPASGRLYRDGVRIALSDPQSAILVCLTTHAGRLVTKDALTEAGWSSQAVTDDSLLQAISRLRKALGSESACFIETVPSRGYRFAAPVERTEQRAAGARPDTDLAPYRAFIEGRAQLHTLNREAIARARTAFEDVWRADATFAPALVGLANACALTFEATRIDAMCDVEAVAQAVRYARRATVLAPSSGEAWSSLALALYLNGETAESGAAAHKAIGIEPDDRHNWRPSAPSGCGSAGVMRPSRRLPRH